MSWLKNERGDTLVEVIMALAILTLVITSAYALATHTFAFGRGAGERSQATDLLQQQAEALRAYRDARGWSNFVSRGPQDFPINPYGFVASTSQPASTFCMYQPAHSTTWQPQPQSLGATCAINQFTVTVTATANNRGLGISEVLFAINATWSTGGSQNQVTLDYILTDH